MRWIVSLISAPLARLVVASRSCRTAVCFFHIGSISSMRMCSFACSTGITRFVSGSIIVWPAPSAPLRSRGVYDSTTFRPGAAG